MSTKVLCTKGQQPVASGRRSVASSPGNGPRSQIPLSTPGPSTTTRRSLLAAAARLGLAASTLGALDDLARTPRRAAAAGRQRLPDIQFDTDDFVEPALNVEGVVVRFPPVYTSYNTIALARTPTRADQERLTRALNVVERAYPFSPTGVFVTLAYGLPYFERLLGGIGGALVAGTIPRLASDQTRLALEEAVPGPTDVGPANPGLTKQTFNVPVVIESNDLVVMLRSDSSAIVAEVLEYLVGAGRTLAGRAVGFSGLRGLLRVTSRRLMFQQMGLPRKVAERQRLPYAARLNVRSPMWMGFADQQVTGSGPAEATTFAGSPSAVLTSARPGDYFDNGSVMHLSHVIEDLGQYYSAPYADRVQFMFRSDPIPSLGNPDQFTDGGGTAFLQNTFQTTDDAANDAAAINTFDGEHRLGHLASLQRSSRAPDTTPLHIRVDGAGFDPMDVPDGSSQPKLQFAILVPSADFFATMRRNQASLDLAAKYGVDPANNGIERFITTTRRQNFLVPPRRHRAFPLVELVPRA
jgi:hypothetical protein